jgi:hypothetical protein
LSPAHRAKQVLHQNSRDSQHRRGTFAALDTPCSRFELRRGAGDQFRSEQALRDYDQNPIHVQAVKEVLQPLVKKFVIYDFRNE